MAIFINGKCYMEGFTNGVKITNVQTRNKRTPMKDLD